MLDQNQTNKIKELAEEFLDKMTVTITDMKIGISSAKAESGDIDIVDLSINMQDPQILIGQQGQTLFEIQRLLRVVLNKRLQKTFYLNLDINDYKKKKVEYLKGFAKETADQVSLAGQEKALPPMSSYERRIVHSELADRTSVITESRGDGPERHIVIRPR